MHLILRSFPDLALDYSIESSVFVVTTWVATRTTLGHINMSYVRF